MFEFRRFPAGVRGPGRQQRRQFSGAQFFLNNGTEAWVSRLYASSVTPVQPSTALPCATSLPPVGSGGGGAATLAPPGKGTTPWTLTSLNPGTWGANIFVTVDYMTNGLNTFNLTATLYSTSSNSHSSSTTYSVVQTQSVPGVTFDPTQSNVITNVMQAASNPYTQLLAIPDVPTLAPPCVPCASGTILCFVAPPAEVPGVEFTITVQPPTPPGSKTVLPLPPAPLTSTFSISSLTDLIVGIQSALSNAAGTLQLPGLGSTVVRSCFSPFPPPPPAQGKPPAGPTQLVQIWSPDPSLAGYLIGVTCNNPSLFTTLTTNYQARQLTYTPDNDSQKKNPDGLPPTGFDVAGNSTTGTGIYALDAMQIVNLILVPDMTAMDKPNYLTAATATLNYAIRRKAFAILDMPEDYIASPSAAVSWANSAPATFGTGIISAATYFPRVLVPSPFSPQPRKIGASGTLAGIYAGTDQSSGVWKAPAGIAALLAGVEQLSYVMNDPENGELDPVGINALRTFPIYGNISWGARTLAAGNIGDEDWKYISVRRLALYIEQSLIQGLQWVVFEPNDDRLWAQIRLTVNGFLHPLYLQGAFVGTSPSQAYRCVCDASTTTAQDLENGIVNILIMFAPVRPAEFVVISLQQVAGQSSS